MILVSRRTGVIMPDMGTFRIDVEVADPSRRNDRAHLTAVLIDTGAELSWFPGRVLESLGIGRVKLVRFRQADGSALERWTGAAMVHAAGTMTVDEVVFAEPGDMTLLGARSLEGLNVTIDPVSKRLVDAGPVSVAAAA